MLSGLCPVAFPLVGRVSVLLKNLHCVCVGPGFWIGGGRVRVSRKGSRLFLLWEVLGLVALVLDLGLWSEREACGSVSVRVGRGLRENGPEWEF